jgi:N-methylhydantoinase A
MDEVIHGTTLVINSIIERKGARTGLITTKGFRDVLELGREIRYAPYDIFSEYPKPLVPRRYRLEVDERVRSDGTILKSRLEKRSTDVLFDESVLKAIERSNPLPPFPEGYRKTHEEFYINFTLNDLKGN